jgi:hypothetical protein
MVGYDSLVYAMPMAISEPSGRWGELHARAGSEQKQAKTWRRSEFKTSKRIVWSNM